MKMQIIFFFVGGLSLLLALQTDRELYRRFWCRFPGMLRQYRIMRQEQIPRKTEF